MQLEATVREWLTRGQPKTPQSNTLDRKQIFILPTRAGIILTVVLLAMLIAALNYNNSLAFIFTFLVAGIALNAMWFTYRQLAGLTLSSLPQSPLFAGEEGTIKVLLENPTNYDHYSLIITGGQSQKTSFHTCPAGNRMIIPLDIHPDTRGLFRYHRFKLATQAPLGIFYAWSWQTLDLSTWAYPKPMPVSPLPLQGGGTNDSDTQIVESDGDDFDSLREHRTGDSPQHISWKHYASKEALLIKQFVSTGSHGVIFSWDELLSSNSEKKLSQLCQCIIDAERQNYRYGLQLPGIEISPGNGETHYRQCLLALAKFGLDP